MSDSSLRELARRVATDPRDSAAVERLWQARFRVGLDWDGNEQPVRAECCPSRHGVFLVRAPVGRPIEMVRVGAVANNTPFLIARFHTTRCDYAVFCQATNRQLPPKADFEDAATGAGEQLTLHPVVDVTIDDARAYCEWLGCSIPTLRQWEIAAYGGDGRAAACARCNQTGQITEMQMRGLGAWAEDVPRLVVCPECNGDRRRRPRYPWGDDPVTDERAVTSRHGRHGYWLHSTAAVGSPDAKGRIVEARPGGASWCGAFDLYGNAAHFVEGHAARFVNGAPAPETTNTPSRVAAIGGSFGSSDAREDNPQRSNHIGFRPVLVA